MCLALSSAHSCLSARTCENNTWTASTLVVLMIHETLGRVPRLPLILTFFFFSLFGGRPHFFFVVPSWGGYYPVALSLSWPSPNTQEPTLPDSPHDRVCRPRGAHVWGHDYEPGAQQPHVQVSTLPSSQCAGACFKRCCVHSLVSSLERAQWLIDCRV